MSSRTQRERVHPMPELLQCCGDCTRERRTDAPQADADYAPVTDRGMALPGGLQVTLGIDGVVGKAFRYCQLHPGGERTSLDIPQPSRSSRAPLLRPAVCAIPR